MKKKLQEKQKLYYNSSDDLIITAIRTGKIGYKDNYFAGNFNISLIKAFKNLGFNFDTRTRRIKANINELPPTIQLTVGRAVLAGQQLAESLVTKLDNINIDASIKDFQLNKKYVDILNRLDKDLVKSASNVVGLNIITTEDQKLKIAQEFTNNLELYIKDFAEKEVLKLRGQIEKNVFAGIRAESLKDDILKEFGISKNKASFLAKQEIGLFTAKYKESKYLELGITQYKWSTSRDSRTREDHKQLNGKIFSFANPPITNKETGARNNPQEDYGCRCVAIPIFDD